MSDTLMVVEYAAGHTRRINFHDAFMQQDDNIIRKAKDVAYTYDVDPVSIVITKGDKVLYETKVSTKPTSASQQVNVSEKQIKKELRQMFKNKPLRKVSFEQLNDLTNWK